jgi:hypothetical protein
MIWKGDERKRSWPNFKVLSQKLPGGTEETYEIFSQDCRSARRHLKPGRPEYDAEVLTTQPRRSIVKERKKGDKE